MGFLHRTAHMTTNFRVSNATNRKTGPVVPNSALFSSRFGLQTVTAKLYLPDIAAGRRIPGDSLRLSEKLFLIGFPKLLNSWRILIDQLARQCIWGLKCPSRAPRKPVPASQASRRRSDRAGHDVDHRRAGRRPDSGRHSRADLTAGLFCSIGILTALLERDFSGEGQCVQASSRAVLSQPPRCPRVP
jgi:hypothetical protein